MQVFYVATKSSSRPQSLINYPPRKKATVEEGVGLINNDIPQLELNFHAAASPKAYNPLKRLPRKQNSHRKYGFPSQQTLT